MDKKEKEALQKQVAALLKSGDKVALAEFLIELVEPVAIPTGILSLLLDTRRLNYGDSKVFRLRKGVKARTLVPGTIHLASEITVKDRLIHQLDGLDVKVTFNERELKHGEIGSIADIRSSMTTALSNAYMNRVFTMLSTVWTAGNTPNNYASAGGNITGALLEAAIDRINDKTGKAVAIVGVRSVLTPITKFGAFWDDGATSATIVGVDSQLEKVVQDGFLGKYYGVPIRALTQVYDDPESDTALLPTDVVIIIGQKVGEFITYGDVEDKQWTDMAVTPPQWYLELWQEFGLIVANAEGIYVIGNIS